MPSCQGGGTARGCCCTRPVSRSESHLATGRTGAPTGHDSFRIFVTAVASKLESEMIILNKKTINWNTHIS